MSEINKDEFEEYESIRESGATNMLDIGKVAILSGGILDKTKVDIIMKNYNELYKKFVSV